MGESEAGNLPAEVTSFFGRRNEIAEVKRLLTEARLVTLTGVGGVGKTRLSARVAAGLRRAFPDGVWLVELAGLQDPELLPHTVAETLRLRDPGSNEPVAAITEYLRDRKILIILDNCEHLRDACAQLASSLLRSAEGVRLLATSREMLRVDGERVFQVPPLPTPDPGGRIPRSHDHPGEAPAALALFADRAAAVLPSFALTADNLALVAQVCYELDGLPLAIELAAVRLRTLSLQQLCERLVSNLNDAQLGARFRLLSGGSRAALPRHQTLAAAVEWSYQLCSPAERLLWQQASVFAGSFDLAAVEAVCQVAEADDPADLLELVAGLVDKSVLTRADTGGDSVARYRMLETLRQFGLSALRDAPAPRDELATRRRHRDFYQSFVEGCEATWFSGEQVKSFRLTTAEHDNLRAALEFSLSTPGEVGRAQQLASSMYYYWVACGYTAEGRYWLNRIAKADVAHTEHHAAALWTAAYLAEIQGEPQHAAPLLAECRALVEELGLDQLRLQLGYTDGVLQLLRDDPAGCAAILDRTWTEHLDEQSVFLMLTGVTLATAWNFCGAHEKAADLADQVVSLCDARGDKWAKSYALYSLSNAEFATGRTAEAITHARDAVRLKRVFQDLFGLALVIDHLARMFAAVEEWTAAAMMIGIGSRIWPMAGGQERLGAASFNDPYHASVRQIRAAIGDTAYDLIVARGAALTIDEGVAYVTGEHTPEMDGSKSDGASGQTIWKSDTLTKREREVAALVAEGMTNRQIADRLVIAQRTAEAHVERVLAKLGFTSRAQIAAWVTSATTGPAGSPGDVSGDDDASGPGSAPPTRSPGPRRSAESIWARGI